MQASSVMTMKKPHFYVAVAQYCEAGMLGTIVGSDQGSGYVEGLYLCSLIAFPDVGTDTEQTY